MGRRNSNSPTTPSLFRWQQGFVTHLTNSMREYRSEIKEQQRRQTFDRNFAELKAYVAQFNRFPEKADNLKLYNWMAALMNENKRRRLPQEYVDELNTIGFIWNRREFNWYEKAKEVKSLLENQNQIPTYDEHSTLYHWLKVQLDLLSKGELPDDKKCIIEEIKVLIAHVTEISTPEPEIKISARELKWAQKFNELVEYRKQNPKSWPQVEATDEQEKKLGIWCQDLRSRNRKQLLESTWRDKLLAINFNLEGRLDNWKDRFEELKTYISTHHQAPSSDSNLYVWARLQYKTFDELSVEKQHLLNSINFLQYFEENSWEKRYAEVQEFILFYKKAPTKKSNQELYSWLTVQRAKYRNNELSDTEKQALLNLGVDLNPIDKREDTWNLKYEALKKFREKHPDRWPSFFSDGIEKRLYQWCQAQRQVYAGTARRRKELSKERIEKLNQISFHWSLDELIDRNWDENFQKLQEFVSQTRTTIVPATLNGKINSLYTWLRRQKKLMEAHRLPLDKIEKLKTLGVI